MLIMINSGNRMKKRDNVRIIRIALDLLGVVVDSRRLFSLNMKSLSYRKL